MEIKDLIKNRRLQRGMTMMARLSAVPSSDSMEAASGSTGMITYSLEEIAIVGKVIGAYRAL